MERQRDQALDLFIVLSRAYHAVSEHSNRDIRRHGLNPTEFGVLELLYHKGEHPLQQIGDKILLASGSITYVVDKLEGKGLLSRRSCPEDRRVTYAVITESGKALIESVFPEHVEAIRHALSGLNEREQATAIELLKKLGKDARSKL